MLISSFSTLFPLSVSLSLPPLLLSPLLSLSWSSQFYCSLSITRCENAWNTKKRKKYRRRHTFEMLCALTDGYETANGQQIAHISHTVPIFHLKMNSWAMIQFTRHDISTVQLNMGKCICFVINSMLLLRFLFIVLYFFFFVKCFVNNSIRHECTVCSTNVNSLQSPSGHWLRHWGKFVLPQLQMSSR